MKTIKFRGKRLDGQGWAYGYYAESDEYGDNGGCEHNYRETITTLYYIVDRNGKPELVIPESVGQWTGLVDMDMVEAYEKDVVDVYFQDGDVERAVLIWDAGRFRYQLKSSERSLWGFDDTLRFKIVGNLIDSPELMEVENGD